MTAAPTKKKTTTSRRTSTRNKAPATTRKSKAARKKAAPKRRWVTKVNRSQLSDKDFYVVVGVGFVVCVIIGIILGVIGWTDTLANPFPGQARTVVVLLNVVLLAWPAIRSIQQKDYVRLIIIVLVVVLMALLLPFVMWVLKPIVMTQLIGVLAVAAVIALILNVWLAVKLMPYDVEDSEFDVATKKEAKAQADIKSAKSNARTHGISVQTAIARVAEAQQHHDDAAAVSKVKSVAFSKASDNIKGNVKLDLEQKAEKALTDAIIQHQQTLAEIAGYEAQIPVAPDEGTRKTLNDKLAATKADVPKLEQAERAADVAYRKAKKEAEADPDVIAYKRADEENTMAANQEAEARRELDDAINAKKAAEDQFNIAGETVKRSRQNLRAAKAELETAEANSKKDSRGFIGGVVGLFVLTLVFYAAYYGWVLEAVYFHH